MFIFLLLASLVKIFKEKQKNLRKRESVRIKDLAKNGKLTILASIFFKRERKLCKS